VVRQGRAPRDSKRMVFSRVAKVLDGLRPIIQSDGGDLELIDVDASGTVHIRLLGSCIGCPSSAITLTLGIERQLKDEVPEITAVVCV